MLNTEDLTIRAYWGIVTIAIARIALIRPGPSTVTTAIASKSDGNDNKTSMMRIRTLSVQPPKNPERRPMSVPQNTANSTAANAAMREMRDP